jgi:hypothetical protein
MGQKVHIKKRKGVMQRSRSIVDTKLVSGRDNTLSYDTTGLMASPAFGDPSEFNVTPEADLAIHDYNNA